MNARLKVSVLIPFYNAERVLGATIRSALSQTYPNKEVILVDDGSSDNSLGIARSFASDNVKIFTQENGGACRARNRALQESTGEYIQYLDADDLLSVDKLDSQLGTMTELNDQVIISARFVRFYEEDDISQIQACSGFLDRSWDNPIDWLVNAWTGKGMGQTAIWLTPRRLIEQAGPWDERLSINQDGEFFCRVLLCAQRIQFSMDGIVYYRSGNKDSVSQNISHKKAVSLLLSYRLNAAHILEKEESNRTKLAVATKYLSFIYTYYDLYPDLSNEARNYFDELGVKTFPVTGGGKNFRLMASLIGFDNSLKLRSLVRHVVK